MKNYQYTRENYPSFREGDYALMYTLRVTLKHVSPKIYRKFEVPSNITLRHLADVLCQKGKSIELEYDFGDGWCHEVRLSGISEYIDDEPHYIYFLKGERACPLEDIGGPWGIWI